MRVISGTSKGRRLTAAVPTGVRPTADRVKEAMFDIVYSRGGIVDAIVGDVFCGSGALGIEALSRGAAKVYFVDSSVRSLKATEENLIAVGLGLETSVRYRATLPGWQPPGPVDVVFADTPYDFTNWRDLLRGLDAQMVIAESEKDLGEIDGWVTTKSRRYGTTLVTVLERLNGDAR